MPFCFRVPPFHLTDKTCNENIPLAVHPTYDAFGWPVMSYVTVHVFVLAWRSMHVCDAEEGFLELGLWVAGQGAARALVGQTPVHQRLLVGQTPVKHRLLVGQTPVRTPLLVFRFPSTGPRANIGHEANAPMTAASWFCNTCLLWRVEERGGG